MRTLGVLFIPNYVLLKSVLKSNLEDVCLVFIEDSYTSSFSCPSVLSVCILFYFYLSVLWVNKERKEKKIRKSENLYKI